MSSAGGGERLDGLVTPKVEAPPPYHAAHTTPPQQVAACKQQIREAKDLAKDGGDWDRFDRRRGDPGPFW